nr:TonB family protein [Candidatus Rhodoblastus alkanivorans]
MAGLICVAHVGLVAALSLVAKQVQVLAPLNVDLIPQGDYFVDTVEVAGPASSEPVSQPQPQPQPQPPADPATAQQTQTEAQAEPREETPPPPQPSPPAPAEAAAPAETQPAREAELEAQEKARRLEAKRRAQAEERTRQRREKRLRELRERREEARRRRREEQRRAEAGRPGGSQGHRAGVANGQAVRAARFNYGAIVAAALNRQKFYPASSRARGETGSVGVTFTVGGSGRIAGYSIYRSSGSSALDGAVRAMMARAHAPPPPGGAFHGSININFNLGG